MSYALDRLDDGARSLRRGDRLVEVAETEGGVGGGEGAEKLAQALGRRPTEHWAEYAHWYYGRWDYDEREGRFDVVLPFPGRFLLAVGEYNRGAKGDERNGKLTHVLYIDARNPAELKSKLLIHPMG